MADLKVQVQNMQKTGADGAGGISKEEYAALRESWKDPGTSDASLKWLQREQPALYTALSSDLDYSGYTGAQIGSLNTTRDPDELKADAQRREGRLDKLPALTDSVGRDNYGANGLEKIRNPEGGKRDRPADVLGGNDDEGKALKGYRNGSALTTIKGDLDISDAEAAKSRAAEKDFCARMSGVIGADVQNPPSANAAKGYFQSMADKGSSQAEIKSEYDRYLKTFYRHPGGGVSFDPKLDPKDPGFSDRLKDTLVAKDGKRLLDCKGYSAVTENVLGKLKQKNGDPMFDLMHAASGEHEVTGVFPHGGDPRKGFVVDNTSASSFTAPDQKAWSQTPDRDARMRYLVRTHMTESKQTAPRLYGTTTTDMRPPK